MPVTGKYNLIQLGNIYLTTDGSSSAKPCRTDIPEIAKLRARHVGTEIMPLEGPSISQYEVTEATGVIFSIRIFQTLDTRLDELYTLLEALIDTESQFVVKITGSTLALNDGTRIQSFNCQPAFVNGLAIDYTGEFQNSYIKDITVNLKVLSKAHILTASAGTLTLTGQSVTLTQG